MESMNQKKSISAVVEIKGHQYQIEVGSQLLVDKLTGKPGDKLKFDQVLLIVDGDQVSVGQPTLKAAAEAEIVEQVKTPKVKVFYYKAKSRSRKGRGHRQQLTKIKINKIQLVKK